MRSAFEALSVLRIRGVSKYGPYQSVDWPKNSDTNGSGSSPSRGEGAALRVCASLQGLQFWVALVRPRGIHGVLESAALTGRQLAGLSTHSTGDML